MSMSNYENMVSTKKNGCLVIRPEEKMKDDEPEHESFEIQFNEERIREYSIPYYNEIKNLPSEYFPINNKLTIDIVDIFCTDMTNYPEDINEAFEVVHNEIIKIISIFSDCKSSVVINEKTKPFCSDKEENTLIIEEQIKTNDLNKKNFIVRFVPLLKDYFPNKHIQEILNEVISNQIQPINEDLLKVFSYYYSYQIVELIRTLNEEVNDYILIEILKSGIGHFLCELLEILFHVRMQSSEEFNEKIKIERMRNNEEYREKIREMMKEMISINTFSNNVKKNMIIFESYHDITNTFGKDSTYDTHTRRLKQRKRYNSLNNDIKNFMNNEKKPKKSK